MMFRACVVGAVFMAACGGSAESEPSGGNAPVLDAATVDTVRVTRVASIQENDPGPFSKTGSDPAKVQALYDALGALTPAADANRVLHCAADFGVTWRLEFAHAGA